LTKSVLGLFPLAIVGAFLILSRQWREIINPWFLSGSLIGLVLGFSWHFINWQHYGQGFINAHFGELIFSGRYFGGAKPFYFLGYAKDFLRNYWPWLPFALVGLAQFGKRGFKDKNETALLLFLWPVLTFLVMSTTNNQVLRYLFMIFPALAIITARTISEWMGTERKNQALVIMAGVIAATVLFVNVTPFPVKVTLAQNSKEVRELAATINLNTPTDQKIGNYRLTRSNPRLAMLFYSNRVMEGPIYESPEKLMTAMSSNPEKTWLTSTGEFRKLVAQHSNTIYLIQANNKYAFFT
jgi:4-amino-4-deoxy-L-arabinose transferase-like glycosyltransferase